MSESPTTRKEQLTTAILPQNFINNKTMYYYFVTINILNESKNEYKRHTLVCSTLKKAIKCADYKAWVYDFKPIEDKWKKIINDYTFWIKFHNKGYITISKRKTWEEPGD